MNTKDYVSFEVAKLLKEKGFNEECDAYYHNDNSSAYKGSNDDERFEYCGGDFFNDRNFYRDAAPTLWDAQKWLREKHNFNIQVEFDDSQLWGWSIHECNIDDMYIDNCSMYNTYEEALNQGIKEGLKLI